MDNKKRNWGGYRFNSGRKPGFIGYWKGKKHPTAFGGKRPIKYGKDNYFSVHIYKGKSHKLWKGNKVGYYALHTWLQRELGKPDTCEFCGKSGLKGKFIHWANKSKKYKRNLKDWLRLCAKCHYYYDRKTI